ncbi:MAG: hypothetical protein IKW30_09955 [Lachnospiraceae bacterium]|nr:hypothetical protein [Lachnospiraceae bacterium]
MIMKQRIIKYCLTFLGMIILFILLLTLVYSIPNEVINNREQKAFDYIKEKEGFYPEYFWETSAARLDNATDYTMIERNSSELLEDNPFISAMYAGDYSRYWHGYQVILRPLLRFFDYQHIRHITMIAFFLLLCVSFSTIHKKLGIPTALCYILSLCPLYLTVVSISLQFISVFVVMFMAIIYLMSFYNTNWLKDIFLFFMVIGMITNFVDFLTAPLLTLGIPLTLFLSLELQNKTTNTLFQILKKEIICVFSWFMGYGLCWGSKWVIASMFLEKNIILDAFNSIVLRTMGSDVESANRLEMLKMNLTNMFYSQGIKITVLYLSVIIIFLVLCILFHKKTCIKAVIFPFVFLSLLPYIWFFVLANHSYVHDWFTYRIQAITLCSILMMVSQLIDWDNIKFKTLKLMNIK